MDPSRGRHVGVSDVTIGSQQVSEARYLRRSSRYQFTLGSSPDLPRDHSRPMPTSNRPCRARCLLCFLGVSESAVLLARPACSKRVNSWRSLISRQLGWS
ncbi:hypothetical protein CCHR01_14173 [Colletotrichum chrysophilum]|uniref:Uncharacterized protein n=1 Tax=Colletotrichum chrysophilum TaxID=1836956 RepID=A0AAD9A7Z9_9PEZI|nr:hypothetical protein CCHR01_14173 [Colletotrichum chrysophilum]